MFEDRVEAGHLLASKLQEKKVIDFLLFTIPRGGVLVAKPIADIFKFPFYCFVVKKIGAPENSELAIGAVSANGVLIKDEGLIKHLKISKKDLDRLVLEKKAEVAKCVKFYGGKMPDVLDKTIVLVDDGVATGSTIVAASISFKKLGAKKIVLATPVIACDTKEEIERYFDEIIFLELPANFRSVGQFYRHFPQVSDEEVNSLRTES